MMTARSSVSRILSASAASWVRIGVTVITQIALVPLYLGAWDAHTYGAWLLLQAVWAAVSIIDLAHHDYVGYECLRRGPAQRPAITRIIFSAAPIVVLIALWDLLLVWQLGKAGFVAGWVGDNAALLAQWRAALLLQAVTWLLTGSLGGLIVRWLTPFGYWPQFAWWGVVYAVVTAMVPALAVVGGARFVDSRMSKFQHQITCCWTGGPQCLKQDLRGHDTHPDTGGPMSAGKRLPGWASGITLRAGLIHACSVEAARKE